MKKLFLVMCLSGLWFSCNSGNKLVDKDGYQIKGKVKFADPGMVVLQKVESNSFKGIDSVKLGKDNSFELKGSIQEPGFYRLNFFNKQNIVLVLDKGENLEVTADGNAAKGAYTVKGSRGTEYFEQVNKLKESFETKVAKINEEFVQAAQAKDEPRQKQLQTQFMALKKENTEAAKKMINQMGTSIVSLYATNFLNPEEDMPFLSDLAKRFEKEKPNNAFAREFVNQVKELEKRMAAMPTIGKQAPEITLNSPEGKPVSLSSLRGKYVLIDFWASWCGPCRQENPNVVRIYNRFKDKNFEIYSVSLDNDRAKWLAAIEKDKLTWTHVSDLKGWQSAGGQAYQVQAIPATFLIDKAGKIIAKNLRGAELESKLEEVFNAK